MRAAVVAGNAEVYIVTPYQSVNLVGRPIIVGLSIGYRRNYVFRFLPRLLDDRYRPTKNRKLFVVSQSLNLKVH